MKLSALLAVSLPLLAMSQAPASAEPNAMADTGSWLKQSITSLKTDHSAPTFKVAAKPAPRKVSHAMPAGTAGYQPASMGVQMRPFMPNRPLPHESDLRRAMVAQQAQMDNSSVAMIPSAPRSLSGEVNYMAPQMVSSYSQYGMSGTMAQAPMAHQAKSKSARAPRLMPGQAPMLPSQLTSNQSAVQPMIPDPPVQSTTANRPQFPVSMPVAMMAQTQSPQMPMQQAPMQGMTPMQGMQWQQWQQQMPMQQAPMQGMVPLQQMPMQGMMPMQQMPMQQMPMQQMPMQNMQWQQQPMQGMMQGYAPSGLTPAATTQRTFMQSMQPMASPAFEAHRLTQQEQLALEKLAAQNRPAAVMDFNGDIHGIAQDNPSNGTGPGPLPMNLLPGNAMQRLSLAHKPANAPQSRFGSWHGDSALPESGFHSWLGNRQPHLFSYRVTPPTGKQTPTARRGAGASHPGTTAMSHAGNHTGHHTGNGSALSHSGGGANRTAMAGSKVTPIQGKAKPLVVASYPTYTSARGMTY